MNFRMNAVALSLAYAGTTNAYRVHVGKCGDSAVKTFEEYGDSSFHDFSDLRYNKIEQVNSGELAWVQFHCSVEHAYEIVVWDSEAKAIAFKKGDLIEDLGPLSRIPIPDIEAYTRGECINAIKQDEDEGFRLSNDGDTFKYPDCTVYDPKEYCNTVDCYPYVGLLGLGFDITKDIEPDKQKQHVFRMDGEKLIVGSGLSHSENSVFEAIARSTQEGSTKSYTDSSKFRSARSAALKVGGTYGVTNIKSSLKLSANEEATFKNSNARSERVMKKGLGKVSLKPTGSDMYPTYQFWKAYNLFDDNLLANGAYCEDPDCYDKFVYEIIRKFGTHYISSITIGGQVKFILETSACLSETERSTAVEAKLCASVKTAKVDGCSDNSSNNGVDKSISSEVSSYTIDIIGPSAEDICFNDGSVSCDFPEFVKLTTVKDSGLIEFELRETVEMMNAVGEIKGRWNGKNGGWPGTTQSGYDPAAFMQRYILEQAEPKKAAKNCDGSDKTSAKIGIEVSLVVLLVSATVSMLMY